MVQDTSTFLKVELLHIERDLGLISNVRGNGTFIGFDTEDVKTADSVQSWCQKQGILLTRAGPATFGLRPALILEPKHAAHLREALKSYHPNHDVKDV